MDDSQILEHRLQRLLPNPHGPDWEDVVHRELLGRETLTSKNKSGRRHRAWPARRSFALAAGVAVLSLAAAVPAFGLSQTVTEWFASPTAPTPTQESFASLDAGAPAGMSPNVSSPARSVMQTSIAGQAANLWVAPTESGGFCMELGSYAMGCDRDRSLPIAWLRASTSSGSVLFGDVLSSQADHLELRYASGDKVVIPLTRVSDPVDASFFVYEVPASDAEAANWPVTIAAIGSDGTTIDSTTVDAARTP